MSKKWLFLLPIRNYHRHKTEAFWVSLGTILTIQLKYFEFAEIMKLSTILTIQLKYFEFAEIMNLSSPYSWSILSLPIVALLRSTKKNWFKWSWFVDMIHRPDLFYIQRVGTSTFLRIESVAGHLASNRCAIASRDCQKKVTIMRRYFWVARGKCFVRSDQSLVNMPTLSQAGKSDELFSKTPWWRRSTTAWGNAVQCKYAL